MYKRQETVDKFDVLVNVRGGGYTGQAGAIRHGIARALLQVDSEYRPCLLYTSCDDVTGL